MVLCNAHKSGLWVWYGVVCSCGFLGVWFLVFGFRAMLTFWFGFWVICGCWCVTSVWVFWCVVVVGVVMLCWFCC